MSEKSKPIKILISTDSAVVHTGLAETTRLLFKELLSQFPGKYELLQLGWFHQQHPSAEKVPWQIVPTHYEDGKPDPQDKYGQRSFEKVRNDFGPDIVYSNGDIWCFDHLLNSPTRNTFRLAAYYTIDGEPYYGKELKPNVSSSWGSKLEKADRLVVLTEYGKHVLQYSCPELRHKNIDVIYHPSDINRFKPLSRQTKVALRQKLYAPGIDSNSYIMGWIGRNQFRKQNYKMWEVLSHIKHGWYIECESCKRVTRYEIDRSTCLPRPVGKLRLYEPDYDYSVCWYCKSTRIQKGIPNSNIKLWMHTNTSDPGWDMSDLTAQWDIADTLIFPGNLQHAFGLAPKQLAELMSTWDCMLYLSGGEGFGIPPYECMAAGVPIIYSNYSSHADFCKHGGLPVRTDLIPELTFSINRAYVDVDDAISKVLYAYRNQEEMSLLGMKGRKFCEGKTPAIIAKQWDKIFTEMMQEEVGVRNNNKIYADII